jgi:glycosyltransferase involved in cell wall biosynthesis
LPEEVLVVDDSGSDETAKLARDNYSVFSNSGIALRYLRGNEENRSISAARNIGIAESTGEILFLIDDDVILYRNYIEEILEIYEKYPMAKGAQGYIVNGVFAFRNFGNFILNAVRKIFLLNHFEKNKCTLRGLTYPYSPDGIIQCEWLHGSNMSFKKEALGSLKFDENLRRRSIGEDVELTFKIHKRYPHSLFMNPQAKLLHIPTYKKVDKHAIYTNIPYLVYLSAKNQEPTLKNIVLNSWFFLGLFIVDGGIPLLVSKDTQPFFCLMKSSLSTISHLDSVKKGDFRFIDSMIQAQRKN